MSAIASKLDDRNIATVTLNRPLVHNAFDDVLINDLTAALKDLEAKSQVRALILNAAGSSFSAGADLHWMRRVAEQADDANRRDAESLAGLLRRLNGFPKPTVAVVQGAAYGGGVGLIAACDIALAADSAAFSLSEVKLGLIPAVISPYVVAAIGQRHARRLFLTGERFTAADALRIGLVSEVVAPDALARAADRVVASLLEGGPRAQVAAKRLIADVSGKAVDIPLIEETARRIANIRASPEGREGVAAFLEKRKPNWMR